MAARKFNLEKFFLLVTASLTMAKESLEALEVEKQSLKEENPKVFKGTDLKSIKEKQALKAITKTLEMIPKEEKEEEAPKAKTSSKKEAPVKGKKNTKKELVEEEAEEAPKAKKAKKAKKTKSSKK